MMQNFYPISHAIAIVSIVLSNNIFGMHLVEKRIISKKHHRQATKPRNTHRRSACFDLYHCYRCTDVTLQRTSPSDFDKELSICCAPASKIFDVLPHLIKQGDSERVAIALKYDNKSAWAYPESRNAILDQLEKAAQAQYEKLKNTRDLDILTQLKNHKIKNNSIDL